MGPLDFRKVHIMTPSQKLELKLGEARRKLAEAIATADPDMEVVEALTAEIRQTDDLLTAAKLVEPEPVETRETAAGETAEQRELAELRGRVELGEYVKASMARTGVMTGAAAEYNQHLGLEPNHFPMDLMERGLETRAARDGDAQGNQGSWVDRVFHETAAERLGITFVSVPPGVFAVPVMTAGGTPGQRGRTQAAAESTYTFAVTEVKPARRAVYGIYSVEDDARVPGLADAIIRDMRMGMVESVDRAIFNGDAGANENTADITGLQTAGIVEATLTQANKIKGDELVKLFLAYVDGRFAASLGDVRIVASVGSNTLWGGTVHAAAVENQTVAAFLRANGVGWTTRGGIDTNTANNDFGAYIGLGRGIDGAGQASVWQQAELITDRFTGAASGEVKLTLNYLWQLAFPRTDNFKRLKYVT